MIFYLSTKITLGGLLRIEFFSIIQILTVTFSSVKYLLTISQHKQNALNRRLYGITRFKLFRCCCPRG